MSETVKLSDTPRLLLDAREWITLRSFAPNDLLALVYINEPYPDEENPSSFFWDRPRSASDAIRCYKTGRSPALHIRQFGRMLQKQEKSCALRHNRRHTLPVSSGQEGR